MNKTIEFYDFYGVHLPKLSHPIPSGFTNATMIAAACEVTQHLCEQYQDAPKPKSRPKQCYLKLFNALGFETVGMTSLHNNLFDAH